MTPRIQEVVVDCANPAGLAAFWAQVLETRWGSVSDGWAVVDAGPLFLCFQQVPEPKSSPKNRLHLDLEVPDAVAAATRARSLGARPTGASDLSDEGDGYLVMRDPEGNEFCFVSDTQDAWKQTLRSALAAPS